MTSSSSSFSATTPAAASTAGQQKDHKTNTITISNDLRREIDKAMLQPACNRAGIMLRALPSCAPWARHLGGDNASEKEIVIKLFELNIDPKLLDSIFESINCIKLSFDDSSPLVGEKALSRGERILSKIIEFYSRDNAPRYNILPMLTFFSAQADQAQSASVGQKQATLNWLTSLENHKYVNHIKQLFIHFCGTTSDVELGWDMKKWGTPSRLSEAQSLFIVTHPEKIQTIVEQLRIENRNFNTCEEFRTEIDKIIKQLTPTVAMANTASSSSAGALAAGMFTPATAAPVASQSKSDDKKTQTSTQPSSSSSSAAKREPG